MALSNPQRGLIGMLQRCAWVPVQDMLYLQYHDQEWGVPVHEDRIIFEFLVLEGFQAGLSWRTVLYKREYFRQAFDQFDPEKIVDYNEERITQLLSNPGIIRNRNKINASIHNAQAFLRIQEEYGSFDTYIWQFVDGKPKVNTWKSISDIPPRSTESDNLSRDLKKRGFNFVGSTICYAHMQATGMVNDHTIECFRYQELAG
jgi:DNA-3-methyladenine glycosylase I